MDLLQLNVFLTKWEGLWLAGAFLLSVIFEGFTAYIVLIEFKYDEQKDLEKKQKKTKTSKKTTTNPGGASIVEETSEIIESVKDEPKND